MSSDENWKQRFEDAKSLLADKSGEFDKLQAKYFQLQHEISMKNIDDKFEPIYVRPDIHDEDYATADYPYLGRSPHRRKSPEGKRRIDARQLSELGETGYHSELSDTANSHNGASRLTDSFQGNRRNSVPRKVDNKALSKKVDMLRSLKKKANTLHDQIENQREDLDDNMKQISSRTADDELSLVDSEIAAQKEMLK